jgi:Tol biopolymer transport system component
MNHKPAKSDKRTRVDRMLDRVKNNPVIAVLLVFGIGLAALASFTDSIKKLLDVVPQITPLRIANVTGAWMSVRPDPITTVKTILVFDFKVDGGKLVGTIHHGYQQALLNGKIEGDTITFDVDQEWEIGGKITVERQAYRGKVVGDKIQFVRTIAGSSPFEFTAVRRVPQPVPLAVRTDGKLANTKLAFSNRHVWIMNANGSDRQRLTRSAADSETSPAWSPDGSKIAYEGHKTSSEFGIYVIHADGSNEKRLSQESEFWADPAWFPGGTRIVFANGSNKPGIYMVNSDGSHLTRLTTGDHATPSVSSSGKRILFHDVSRGRIVVMDADGSDPRELADGNHPAWSPDGTKIAFDRGGAENSSQIVVMNADGSNPVTLTEDWARAMHPAWSPDGTLIAFVSNREGESEIFIMNTDGSNKVNVSNLLSGYERVAWSPVLSK